MYLLDYPQIGARFHCMCSKGVPQRIKFNLLLNFCPLLPRMCSIHRCRSASSRRRPVSSLTRSYSSASVFIYASGYRFLPVRPLFPAYSAPPAVSFRCAAAPRHRHTRACEVLFFSKIVVFWSTQTFGLSDSEMMNDEWWMMNFWAGKLVVLRLPKTFGLTDFRTFRLSRLFWNHIGGTEILNF